MWVYSALWLGVFVLTERLRGSVARKAVRLGVRETAAVFTLCGV